MYEVKKVDGEYRIVNNRSERLDGEDNKLTVETLSSYEAIKKEYGLDFGSQSEDYLRLNDIAAKRVAKAMSDTSNTFRLEEVDGRTVFFVERVGRVRDDSFIVDSKPVAFVSGNLRELNRIRFKRDQSLRLEDRVFYESLILKEKDK